MKLGVVVFPGSNCDMDCYYVLKEVMKVRVDYLWHTSSLDEDYDCIILPGGFSYGDYLRTGAIARFSPVMNSVLRVAEKGKLILGICNGFQILLEAGLLPGAMIRNKSLRFICKPVHIRVENTQTPFSQFAQPVLEIPIAHMQGNYYIDEEGLKRLREKDQIVFRYCSRAGEVAEEFNPNGSVDNIAGIINEKGNVLGMMPHPERCSESALGGQDGKLIFQSIINYLSN